jgi:hypothetical protein
MDRMVVKSTVSDDGVLHLALPVGIAEANREVQVTVEPVPASPSPPPSPEQWREMVLATSGKWRGDFERPAQGEYEQREPLP